MTKVLLTESYLENIADAIRAKTGSQDEYTPAEMSEAIDSIPSAEDYFNTVITAGTNNGARDSGWIKTIKKMPAYTCSGTSLAFAFAEYPLETLDLSKMDTSNISNMKYMFYSSKTTSLDLSRFNTSKVTDMTQMFYGCAATSLDLSNFDMGKLRAQLINNQKQMFSNALQNLNFGYDLGKGFSADSAYDVKNYGGLGLSHCPNLTHDSLMSAINNLYDLTTINRECNLILGSTNLEKLTAEEIAIATNKGWTVS